MNAIPLTHAENERAVFDLSRRYLERVVAVTPDGMGPALILAALAQTTAVYLCANFDPSRHRELAARIEALIGDVVEACEGE